MAGATCERSMRTRQCVGCGIVPIEREERRLETAHRMADVAVVDVWRILELAVVLVAVAIIAAVVLQSKYDLVHRRPVALPTLNRLMLSDQGKLGRRMLGNRKLCGFEAFHRVTGGALTLIGTIRKLISMRTGAMAISAALEGRRFAKHLCVALFTCHRGMLTHQAEMCLVVVKANLHRGESDAMPTDGGMAGLAGRAFRERFRMGILVAGVAAFERQPGPFRFVLRAAWDVALLACQPGMGPD